eukprot:767823-Hanusia_phi.AAC.2
MQHKRRSLAAWQAMMPLRETEDDRMKEDDPIGSSDSADHHHSHGFIILTGKFLEGGGSKFHHGIVPLSV